MGVRPPGGLSWPLLGREEGAVESQPLERYGCDRLLLLLDAACPRVSRYRAALSWRTAAFLRLQLLSVIARQRECNAVLT